MDKNNPELLTGIKAESSFYVGAGAEVDAVLVDGVTGEYARVAAGDKRTMDLSGIIRCLIAFCSGKE